MHHITCEKQRYARRALLDGYALQFVGNRRIDNIHDRPQPSGTYLFLEFLNVAAPVQLIQLSDFVFERHARQYGFDALVLTAGHEQRDEKQDKCYKSFHVEMFQLHFTNSTASARVAAPAASELSNSTAPVIPFSKRYVPSGTHSPEV